MITKKDLEISNTSYTKKDFYQIYPEILDLVTKITARWNPDSSNESDPGVVLLKLLSFIADKNNYNIDKNILECFMPSATQESSMRKLCEMMGYSIKYYQSATTNITLEYIGTGFEDTGDDKISKYISIPKFTTTFTNEDGDINYVLIKDINLGQKYEAQSASVIEGTLCEATPTSPNVITLTNLDDNNRFYLPESNIAENGIWIRNLTVYNTNTTTYDSEEKWTKVDNLNTQTAGTKVWKFGYDSKQSLPYIEFPDDISGLIGLGLNIRYVRTTGINGNTSANTLTSISSVVAKDADGKSISLDPVDGSKVIIVNNSAAATNGSNPETLDEAYSNFKKTVGTFDTLVTCRDYANKIYNMVSDADNTTPLVSNIQVSDIRDDLDRSNSIMTYNEYGLGFKNQAVVESGEDKINHFDLLLYPFTPITGIYNKNSYIQSFRPYIGTLDDIKSSLEEYKTIAHNIITPDLSEEGKYCIKNYYDLNAKITTNYKITSTEKKAILSNIYSDLYKKFNLRNVDFGEEIPFDTILDCIQNADSRIKNVSLAEPTLITKTLLNNGTEELVGGDYISNTSSNRKHYIDLLAKNIIAGRVPLFDYNEAFDYELGQYKLEDYDTVYGKLAGSSEEIDHITTEVNITPTNYTLKDNEVIQIISPSLSTEITYPVNINYNFHKEGATDGSSYIKEDSEYVLKSGDILYINYTDSDDEPHNIKYESGTIIKPNFNLYDSSYVRSQNKISWAKTSGWDETWNIEGMFSLDTNQQIEKRKIVKTALTTDTKCYWLVNNTSRENGIISATINFDSSDNSYILKEGEYFFYTNDAETELVTLGSGTKIISWSADPWTLNYDTTSSINKDDIASKGIGAFVGNVWKTMHFSSTQTPTFQEMQFITLTSGDTLTSITSSTTTALDNTWKPITGATYVIGDTSYSIAPLDASLGEWQIRSRLDFNLGPKLDQALVVNQSMTLYDASGTSIGEILGSETNGPLLKCNYLLQQAGGKNISTKITVLNDSSEVEVNDLSIMVFGYTAPSYIDSENIVTNLNVKNLDSIYTKIDLSTAITTTIKVLVPTNSFGLLMFYYVPGTKGSPLATLTTSTTGASLSWYNGNDIGTSTLNEGINVIKISGSCTLTLSRNGETSGNIVIDSLRVASTLQDSNGIDMDTLALDTNAEHTINGSTESAYLLSELSILDVNREFYYSGTLDTSLLIDSDDMSDPHILYDYNNVYNKFVVSELYVGDEDDDSVTPFAGITIARSSLL